MISVFPDKYHKTIYDINYEALKENNKKLLLFDVDGTIVKDEGMVLENKTIELFYKLKRMGFTITLFSNRFALDYFDEQGYPKANKPFQKGFRNVQNKNNVTKEEMVIIGNDPLTDILGGKIFGIDTILVDTIGNKLQNNVNKILYRRLKK